MTIKESLACRTFDDFIFYLIDTDVTEIFLDMKSQHISDYDKMRFLYRCDLAIQFASYLKDRANEGYLKNLLATIIEQCITSAKNQLDIKKNIKIENDPYTLLLLRETYPNCHSIGDIEQKNFELYLPDKIFYIKRAKLNSLLEDTISRSKEQNRNTIKIMHNIKQLRLVIAEIDETLDDDEKLLELEQAVLDCYRNIKLNQGMFELSHLLVDKLENFMMSASGLNLVYRYGHQVKILYPVPILKSIRYLQTEAFNMNVINLFSSSESYKIFNSSVIPPHTKAPKSLYQYMKMNQFLFQHEVSKGAASIENIDEMINNINSFISAENYENLIREVTFTLTQVTEGKYEYQVIHECSQDKRHIARMRCVLQDLARQNKEVREVILSWITERDMDEDKRIFPFTCAYQKLKICLSPYRLKTNKKPFIDALMKDLEKIYLNISQSTTEEEFATEALQAAIAQTYCNVVTLKQIYFFESNLANALVKFTQAEFNLSKEDLLHFNSSHRILPTVV